MAVHRPRQPLRLWSIVVIAATLWLQAVYALHGGCLEAAPRHAVDTVSAMAAHAMPAVEHHCDGKRPRPGDATCQAHCDTPTGSTDVARIPPVPALPPNDAAVVSAALFSGVPPAGIRTDYRPPAIRPRGPTGHPALLLLI